MDNMVFPSKAAFKLLNIVDSILLGSLRSVSSLVQPGVAKTPKV